MLIFLSIFLLGTTSILLLTLIAISNSLSALFGIPKIAYQEIKLLLQRPQPPRHPRTEIHDPDRPPGRTILVHTGMYDTWRRTTFSESQEGCTIYAWPLDGVVIKDNADAVEMLFLGFNRFDPPTHRFPSHQQEHEDAFARQLFKIGGKFWDTQQRCALVRGGMIEPECEERMYRAFGWEPADGSGGVWELAFDDYDNSIEDRIETARLRMALTMEERCMVLKRLGAIFYENPRECEGLKMAYPPVLSPEGEA
jgi:hypothetical protein